MTDIAPPDAHVQDAWIALLDALARAGYAVDELARPGASPAQFARAQETVGRALPADLAGLYQLSDGQTNYADLADDDAGRERGRWVGPVFGDGWTFDPIGELADAWTHLENVRAHFKPGEMAQELDRAVTVRGNDPVLGVYSSPDWIPFASDGGGNFLAADLAPRPGGTVGQVIVIGRDEDLRRVLAPGLVELLRWCTERLGDLDPDQADPEELAEGVLVYDLEVS
ncbi:SMI1/KNR4 family protein [Kineosporia sp. NBRC 101731]|uniref:SMI1/KNR4 family protein n=1 Tax=Kineosporia sp. NBRC 101731 TaxID=3032199 RepID=UPI0024A443C2|nr:SMI1/KNR4 family protein [Kineosporia sp. NBRC 101731]GLY27903.1 hypothetical protein Kisp02_12680 [Kineosporia sp. NBRC 101731]